MRAALDAAGICATALGGWLLLLWEAAEMHYPVAQLMMPLSEWQRLTG
jgi:hypothetical protein